MKRKLFNLFSLIAILALLVPAGGMPVIAQEPSVAEAAGASIEIYRNTTTTPNTPLAAPADLMASVSNTNVPLAGTSAQAIDVARAGSPLSSSGTFTVYLPLIQSSQPPVTPVIPDTTQVLTNQTTQYLTAVSGDGAVFTFTQSTAELRNLAPGDVMVSGVTAAAPYGFLRKVTTVTTLGGQTVVQTTAATLEDAMQQGEAHVSQALTPSQIQSARYSEGVTLVRRSPAAQDATFYLEIKDVVLFDADKNPDTTYDQVLANGSIEIEPTLNFDLIIRNWKVEQLRFTEAIHDKVEIKVESKVNLVKLQQEKELVRYQLAPILTMVGTMMPVVYVPILTFVVGVDGSVYVSVSAKVTQEATLTGGVQYVDGNWGPVSGFTNQFQWQPPTLSAGLELKGYAGPRFEILLYGVVGPQLKLDGYVKLEANTAETPWWKLYGGLELGAEVDVEIYSKKIVSYTYPAVIGVKWLLAQAQDSNRPPTIPASPFPADGAISVSPTITLSWSGGDLDGDVVSYTVALGKSFPPSSLSVNQTATSFNPGLLESNTHYYWQVVARDEHNATTTGPLWNFTTTVSTTPPITPTALITLTLQPPQVSGLTASVSGTVTATNATITRLNWQWGDGVSNDQWFPASHTYAISGTYRITATAYSNLGNTKVQTTTAHVGLNTGDMVLVPAGNFQMGCDPAHNGGFSCNSYELPLHTVYLDAYRIDKYEVTNAQYAQCAAAGSCTAPLYNSSYLRSSYYGNPTYANYPVIYVSWYNARDYCAWAGKRLPTEAEWEKAARGSGDTRAYPWGDQSPNCSLANSSNCVGDTTQVGSYPSGASPYGALDMAGNVWEWVNDWYQSNYYSVSPSSNPPGPANGGYKVLRGGSFFYNWNDVRAANRGYSSPLGSSDYYHFGFRCAGVAPGQ